MQPIDPPSEEQKPRVYERGDPRNSSVKDDLVLQTAESRLAQSLPPKRIWALGIALALAGYGVLAVIAYGRLGFLEVVQSFREGNEDAGAAHF